MEERMKIHMHSFVDVITNSSTVIYTYQSGCVDTAKAVIKEVLELEGRVKTVEDLFYFGVFYGEDSYSDYLPEEIDNLDSVARKEKFKSIIADIMQGKIEKPQWMKEAEGNQRESDSFEEDTFLHILPKEEKYKPLIIKLLSFLGSVTADGGSDG